MKIAVVGGGINGLCCAWQLAQAKHQVTLFERGELLHETSMASSKLLHGGLRYLEHGELRLVHEALQERQWWLKHAPNVTRRLPILYPIYQSGRRARWQLKLGLLGYDWLSGKKGIGRHRWLTAAQTLRCSPQLKTEGLMGAYLFFDGQMDEQGLGQWVANKAKQHGAKLLEFSPVNQVTAQGELHCKGETHQFDRIINVAGPWSEQLLTHSNIQAKVHLDLVRGSHLLLPHLCRYGHMLEVPNEKRIVFVLPYKKHTLLGTTEVRQTLAEPIACSSQEREYLLSLYNHYFCQAKTQNEVLAQFAGVRPLIASQGDASQASREYALTWYDNLLTVTGGKWTTARALAKHVVEEIEQAH